MSEKARIAILATNGFEQSELLEPQRALSEAGFQVEVIAPKAGSLRGWKAGDWAEEQVEVDVSLADADAASYDGLVLPGGVINADHLRVDESAVAFVRAFTSTNKPIAAICHAAWALIEAGFVRGKTMTSYPTLRTDLENAGATWVDEAVVLDGRLVTSRKPDDLPEFNAKFIEVLHMPPLVMDEQDDIDTKRRKIDAAEIDALISQDNPTIRAPRHVVAEAVKASGHREAPSKRKPKAIRVPTKTAAPRKRK